MIQVYKFGGASMATPERMKALLPIIQEANTDLVIIGSAYGKTTNALEEVVLAIWNDEKQKATQKAEEIKKAHLDYAQKVLSKSAFVSCEPIIQKYFSALNQQIKEPGKRDQSFLYDQIVGIGELLSTTILASFLKENQVDAVWVDARDLILTNNQYRQATVDENKTQTQIQKHLLPLLSKNKIIVTQGFIGSTSDKNMTTLGREGSDYSGALIAAFLPASSLSIWKDVAGFLTADPRKFPHAEKIPEITFHEVIEIAFYGAQIIHPNTISPLKNADIPLWVKCFLKPHDSGTLIHNTNKEIAFPPLIVLKEEQCLIQVTSRDFSFINEGNLSYLYRIFHRFSVKINLIQNAAISVVFVVNNEPEKLIPLIETLEKDYEVLRNDHQTLVTVRHYHSKLLTELTKGKKVILTQKTRKTVQIVMA